MSKLFFCEDFLLEDHRDRGRYCPFCRGMELEEETNRLQAKLSLYTSWQPSDPVTKEAMEAVNDLSDGWRHDWRKFAHALGRALTAAMVRLEKAEKKLTDAKQFQETLKSRIRDLEGRS